MEAPPHMNVGGQALPPPPPPPPPPYAAHQQEMYFPGPHQHQSHHMHHPHSPTRRGAPVDRDDGLSESIDPAKYKTRMCQAYMMGATCAFGPRCAFAHGHNELRQSAPSHHQGGSHQPSGSSAMGTPPPPSYYQAHQEFVGTAGPSSPPHSRPQSPRGMVQAFPSAADAVLSPSKLVHPRNSQPSSPVTGGEMAFPMQPNQRFRNEPYSPTGFVTLQANGETAYPSAPGA